MGGGGTCGGVDASCEEGGEEEVAYALVFQAHRRLSDSTLGLRAITQKRNETRPCISAAPPSPSRSHSQSRRAGPAVGWMLPAKKVERRGNQHSETVSSGGKQSEFPRQWITGMSNSSYLRLDVCFTQL